MVRRVARHGAVEDHVAPQVVLGRRGVQRRRQHDVPLEAVPEVLHYHAFGDKVENGGEVPFWNLLLAHLLMCVRAWCKLWTSRRSLLCCFLTASVTQTTVATLWCAWCILNSGRFQPTTVALAATHELHQSIARVHPSGACVRKGRGVAQQQELGEKHERPSFSSFHPQLPMAVASKHLWCQIATTGKSAVLRAGVPSPEFVAHRHHGQLDSLDEGPCVVPSVGVEERPTQVAEVRLHHSQVERVEGIHGYDVNAQGPRKQRVPVERH